MEGGKELGEEEKESENLPGRSDRNQQLDGSDIEFLSS
jgi:hypothetical protein